MTKVTDRNGYCILQERFHEAVFELSDPLEAVSGVSRRVDGPKLGALLAGQPETRAKKGKSAYRALTRGSAMRIHVVSDECFI